MLAARNQPLHIAICDDDPTDRQQAADLTREILTAEGLSCNISTYDSATALLTAIQGGAQFHILLLDGMMDGLDGMKFAAALRKLGDNTAIIFMSCGENGSLAIMLAEGYEKFYLDKACTQEPVPSDENGERTLYTVK